MSPSTGEASEGSGKREGSTLLWSGDHGKDSAVVHPEVGGEQGEEERHPEGQEGARLQTSSYARGMKLIFH